MVQNREGSSFKLDLTSYWPSYGAPLKNMGFPKQINQVQPWELQYLEEPKNEDSKVSPFVSTSFHLIKRIIYLYRHVHVHSLLFAPSDTFSDAFLRSKLLYTNEMVTLLKLIVLKTDFILHFMQSAVYCGRIA